MSTLDFKNFAVDANVRPFIRDFRADLLAPDIEIESTGVFYVFKFSVPKGQRLVVKALVPYAMERTAVGTSNEDAAMLDPALANGHFAFEPKVNGQAPVLINIDYNTTRIASGTLSNNDRIRRNGFSMISADPVDDAKKEWYNPMFSFVVASDSVLSVTFTILANSATSPFPNPYAIAVNAQRRVDFAGVVVAGLEIPEQAYLQMEDEQKNIYKSDVKQASEESPMSSGSGRKCS